MTGDDGKTPADRLEQAMRDFEERKKAAAMAAEMAPERERLAALRAQIEALPQAERRQVLDAAGFKHVSAAPKPLEPVQGGTHVGTPGLAAARWPMWGALPIVKLWEAVLLSLGIEPEDRLRDELIRGPRARFERQIGRQLLLQDAFDRLSACKKALSYERGPIRPQGSLYRGMLSDSECPVLLAEVAAFLVRAGFTVSEEMNTVGPADTATRTDSKEDREDRRLKACEDAGLTMPTSPLGRLPDGINKMAKADGVSRQTYSADVKAALKRRKAARAEGRLPSRA